VAVVENAVGALIFFMVFPPSPSSSRNYNNGRKGALLINLT